MALRHQSSWLRYGATIVAVVVATAATVAIPLFRDRLTFFVFWPTIVAVTWLAGEGPAVVATLLSALAVVLVVKPSDTSAIAHPGLPLTLVVFVAIGVFSAMFARWRARSETDLRESRDRFEGLANAAPVLVWMAGADEGCTYFNRAWLEFTGRALDRELGEGWLDGVHPEDRARRRASYATAFVAGQPFEVEYRLRRADGAYRWFLDRGVPRRASSGRVIGYIGSCTDITDQREALAAATTAREVAEAASRAKDAFLATVSHELRTPLAPILTWVRMLRGGELSDEQRARGLEVIERNARLQGQLVEDLLDVARIVEGKLRLQVRPVALGTVVHNAVETVRPAAEAKDIRLQVVVDTTIPPIPGDADRLQQVVWNLLSNAVKFTPRGGRVHVVLERVNSHLEIAVGDTGRGIPGEQRAHLFERFWQADSSASRAHQGLGLGLAIVRHLVELHGGSVTAESPGEGQGSTFTVKLPVAPMRRTAGEEVRRHPTLLEDRDVGVARLDGIRVLLVDDEPDANEALRVLLEQCGADVRVAGSVAQAVEILQRWTPDVLVSDVGMPVEDGYALIAKVRAQPGALGRVPAIALTAYASVEDRVRLLAAGFQLHLAKPAEPGELTTAIAAVTGRTSPE